VPGPIRDETCGHTLAHFAYVCVYSSILWIVSIITTALTLRRIAPGTMDKIVKGARRMRRAAAFLKNMTIHVKVCLRLRMCSCTYIACVLVVVLHSFALWSQGSPPKTTEVTAELAIKAGYVHAAL
jgi:hypothetical protein